jgi:hypothetical protein
LQCQVRTCNFRTAEQRDLDRHHIAKHNLPRVDKPQYFYHCSIATCPWSVGRTNRRFTRRDHAKRHVDQQHPGENAATIRRRI